MLVLEEVITKLENISNLSKLELEELFESSSEIIYNQNPEKKLILDTFILWIKYYFDNEQFNFALKKTIEALNILPNSPYLLYFASKIFLKQNNNKSFLKNSYICLKEIEKNDFIKTNLINIDKIKDELNDLIKIETNTKDIGTLDTNKIVYSRTIKETIPNTVSACLIVKNEQDVIETCLKSLVNVVDEIIIVDTGSTDKTIEIAKKYTDKIFNFQWDNDFSKARNRSLEEASGEWILLIDADEELTNITKEELKTLITKEDIATYYVLERSLKENQIYYLLRLFRNVKEIFFKGIIHEQITEGLSEYCKNNNLKGTISPIIIIHHDQKRESKNKDDRNIELLRKTLSDPSIKDINFVYYCIKLAVQILSKTHIHFDELKEVKELFDTVYKILKEQNFISNLSNFPTLISFAVNYSSILETFKDFNKSMEITDFALKYFPTELKLNFKKAALHNYQKEYLKALEHIKKCIYLIKTNTYFKISNIDNELIQLKVPMLCASIYESLGSIQVAHEWYFDAYIKAPNYPNLKEIILNISKKPKLDKISTCLCIREYSDNLEKTLESASNIANEIVLTYLGNPNEKTLEILSKYKVRLFTLSENEYFEVGLHNSHEMALYNWILFLQPNEIIKTSKEVVSKMLSRQEVLAYKLPSNCYDYFFNDQIRLFRNIPNFRYSQNLRAMAYAEQYAQNRSQIIYGTGNNFIIDKINQNL